MLIQPKYDILKVVERLNLYNRFTFVRFHMKNDFKDPRGTPTSTKHSIQVMEYFSKQRGRYYHNNIRFTHIFNRSKLWRRMSL